MDSYIRLRISLEEKEAWFSRAGLLGLSLSEYIRSVVSAEISGSSPGLYTEKSHSTEHQG